jgi:hypothetical protein
MARNWLIAAMTTVCMEGAIGVEAFLDVIIAPRKCHDTAGPQAGQQGTEQPKSDYQEG